MSWETLISGELEFIGEVSKDELDLIQDKLEVFPEEDVYWKADKLCIEKKNTKGNTTVRILSVNWTSHVDEERIREMLKALEKRLIHYSLSLYYLGELYLDFHKEGENNE